MMVPLVTRVEEIREVREIAEELKNELNVKNIPYKKDIKIGVMIETPAGVSYRGFTREILGFFQHRNKRPYRIYYGGR